MKTEFPTLRKAQREQFKKLLIAWWLDNGRNFKWRRTSDKYETLMAELLLRRTNAKAVESVYSEFLDKYPDAASFGKSKRKDIEKLLWPLGLHWRVENVVALANYFSTVGPDIPDDVHSLSMLPGVGPYVSRAVLVNCSGLVAVPVDSNVVRVVCRLVGATPHDNLRRNTSFQRFADSFVDAADDVRSINYAFLDFASLVCTASQPKCNQCPVARQCRSRVELLEYGA